MLLDHVHAKTEEEILTQFETRKVGLHQNEVPQRQKRFGPNSLPDNKSTSPLKILFRQFKNLMVAVLTFAALLSLYYGHHLDVAVIAVVILLNVVIGFVQEYRAEKAIKALKNLVVPKAKVKRNDTVFEISSLEIVPGDIIVLEAGDRVPADARLLYTKNLQAHESTLTGESMPVSKHAHQLPVHTDIADQVNMLFSGTSIVSGTGEAVVVAIGSNTALGRIAKGLEEIQDSSGRHFLEKNSQLVTQMSIFSFVLAAITFVVGYFFRGFALEEILVFTLAALVSAIPESLPIIVIVVLSISARRMAHKNAIVRTLPSTETLSIVDTIITDKTGTLTLNRMTVEKVITQDSSKLMQIAYHCNTVRIEPSSNKDEEEKVLGDPTEIAFFQKARLHVAKDDQVNKLDDLPFDQQIKARASLVEIGSKKEMFTCGAPESILSKSSHYIDKDGHIHEMTQSERENVEADIRTLTGDAMRTIGFAYRPVAIHHTETISTHDVKDLTWVGIMGIIDPPRPESKKAIEQARHAGIRVIMATGDHPETALAISKQIGLTNSDTVYTGSQLTEMSDENLLIAAKETNVFARMTPEAKLRLAQILQKAGYTIAMTGDGVNDAPALKGADIGIAMGKNGTDVARESSDIVLADDNFATIIAAIEEGRTQFRNIRRTSFFLITTALAQSVTLISFLIAGLPLPLLPKQILWINLVGSGVTDIALATEPIHEDVLNAPPRDKHEQILNRKVLPMLIALTVLMTASSFIIHIIMAHTGEAKTRTAIFVLLSLMQIINMFNLRSLRHSVFKIGLWSNRNVNLAFVASIILLLSVIYIPQLARIFEFVPLTILELISLAIISSSVLVLGEGIKRITEEKL